MDNISLVLNALLTVILCRTFTDGLIGLKPAPKPKPKNEDKAIPTVSSPNPIALQNTQLHSPYRNPDVPHNFSVVETKVHNKKDNYTPSCHAIPMLECSFRLLKQTVLNASSVCKEFQEFRHCTLNALRQNGRKDFVSGLSILEDLQLAFRKLFVCLDNEVGFENHVRHMLSKRNSATCCSDGILNCAVEAFFKMASFPEDRCRLIEFYDICMNEQLHTCQPLTSVFKVYPIFVSQLKTLCFQPLNRKRRSVKATKLSKNL